MKVGRYNYPSQFPNGTAALMADLKRMLLKGSYVLSPDVTAFEAAYAEWNGTRFAKGVNTGTDALAVTFAALRVTPGDEIITQANTFNATVNAILMAVRHARACRCRPLDLLDGPVATGGSDNSPDADRRAGALVWQAHADEPDSASRIPTRHPSR